MKRIVCAIISILLLASLCACSDSVPENRINSRDDVPGSVIGVLEDTAAVAYAEKRGTVRVCGSGDELVAALKAGSVDCAVVDDSIAEKLVRGQHKLTLLEEPLISAGFCFAVARENADLTAAVNDALSQLTDSGVLQDIIDGYFDGGKYVYTSPEDLDRSKGTLTLAVGSDFPPYKRTDMNGDPVGLDIDVARAVCDILGLDMKVSVVTDDSLISTVMHGNAHFALGGLFESEARSELIDYSDPYVTCTQRIIVRKK